MILLGVSVLYAPYSVLIDWFTNSYIAISPLFTPTLLSTPGDVLLDVEHPVSICCYFTHSFDTQTAMELLSCGHDDM